MKGRSGIARACYFTDLGSGFPVALFHCTRFKSAKMFPQRLAHQCRTVPFRSARGLVGSLKRLFAENNLDGFHMSAPLDSLFQVPFPKRALCSQAAVQASDGVRRQRTWQASQSVSIWTTITDKKYFVFLDLLG